MKVLRLLNVAPIQLYPNCWAALQAFWLVCEMLNLTTSTLSLFYYTWLGNKVTWLSLYTASYKHFKKSFFKVGMEEGGKKYFHNSDISKFPFYWMNNHEIKSW